MGGKIRRYLEIGIGIPTSGDTAIVDIALGDTTYKELLLSVGMWKGLLANRFVIFEYLARRFPDNGGTPLPLKIDTLTVRFGIAKNQRVIHMDAPTKRVTLSAPAVGRLFALQHCVDVIVNAMTRIVGRVETKLKRFRDIASGDPANAVSAIRDSESFDRDDLIDCELLALVFDIAFDKHK